jgi:hypothetical protein
MIPSVTIRHALADPKLLGDVLVGESWLPWRVLLIAAMGEALSDDERLTFQTFTGRDREPGQRVEECCVVKGRRAGGSRATSVLATYIAGLCHYPALVPGERGVLLIVAADQRQADVVLDYIDANFRNSPVLSQLIEARTARELRLTNNIDIEVRASDFRRLRGLTYIAVIADEVAFWMTEGSVNPDDEILNAVRPGLATSHGPLFMISSPYARRGELWRTYQKHYGPGGDRLILVAKGASRDFNSTLAQSVVDRAYERDPVIAGAEYGAEFRSDIESFVSLETVEAAVVLGRYELPRADNVRYHGFVDPSGGSSDSMTLAVAHTIGDNRIIIGAIRERRPPFSPDDAVGEFATLLKSYGIGRVKGDRYGGEWPREVFHKRDIEYGVATEAKSDLYRNLLPLLNSGCVELLDHKRLVAQLCSLERRAARGGRDSIDHPPGAHDDIANCVAGVAITAVQAAAVPEVPIVGPLLFNLRTGEIIPTKGRANCAPPPGYDRRSCDEPWWPYVGGCGVRRDRWSPDW